MDSDCVVLVTGVELDAVVTVDVAVENIELFVALGDAKLGVNELLPKIDDVSVFAVGIGIGDSNIFVGALAEVVEVGEQIFNP